MQCSCSVLRFLFAFAALVASIFSARIAGAEPCIPTRAVLDASSAVVRVDARGATSLGVVFRDAYTVVAPLDFDELRRAS